MRRCIVGLTVLMILALLAAPLPADAQQRGKTYRIGYLDRGQPSPRSESFLTGFRQGMREHGYLEGQNYVMEYRWERGQHERRPALVAELVRFPVDVILTAGTGIGLIAKQVTTMVPIVVASAVNPVKLGLIASMAHPGGNVTGVAYPAASVLSGKKLELLMEMAPQMSRVALVWDPNNLGLPPYKEALEVIAQRLGLTVYVAAIRGPDDVDTALAALGRARVGGLLIFTDAPVLAARRRIIAFADQHRLPEIWSSDQAVRDGGLMSYGPNFPDMFRRAAAYVVKILQGAKPADLPMARVDRIDLAINLQAAQRRGLTIPPELLFQATEVIR